ncbi:RES family NAD+ phosphorylase [Chromobacterium vaccinii]|uniref:RES family NAD+ phosphorylase n=1 Tax=Chromobacterium vaccinii TaxID=1108595 RepID=UPI0018F1D5E1|nr:RES family NAD+ phosphorylase [Chromobacterium sp. ATCC 53434]
MIGWRISNYADLNGLGGLRADGRWHHAGRPVVYLADHAASAMLEMLVHSELRVLPASFQLLKVELPDEAILALDPVALPDDWRAAQGAERAGGGRLEPAAEPAASGRRALPHRRGDRRAAGRPATPGLTSFPI